MNSNLCDRTSISNITILDEKDRKAFEFRRLTHKMSNLAKRIQKQKAQSKAQRCQFQSMQSKFNILTQTAEETIQQIESGNKKNETKIQSYSVKNETDSKAEVKKTKQSKSDDESMQDLKGNTKQLSQIKNLRSENEQVKRLQTEHRFQSEIKRPVYGEKGQNQWGQVVKKSVRIKMEQMIYALVFSLIICLMVVRSSFLYI